MEEDTIIRCNYCGEEINPQSCIIEESGDIKRYYCSNRGCRDLETVKNSSLFMRLKERGITHIVTKNGEYIEI